MTITTRQSITTTKNHTKPTRIVLFLVLFAVFSLLNLLWSPETRQLKSFSSSSSWELPQRGAEGGFNTVHSNNSSSNVNKKGEPQEDEDDEEAIQWHWTRYRHSQRSNDTDTGTTATASNTNDLNILIAQQSGNQDKYRHLLDITQRTNRAYAKKWNYDYVALTGLALGGYKSYHANFNKIRVLEMAMSSRRNYDGVLLLDADALIQDMDYSVADELDPRYAIVARTEQKHDPHSWQFNNGVVLWNLRHRTTPWLIRMWKRLAKITIRYNLQKHKLGEHVMGDQSLLDLLVLSRSIHPGRKHIISTNSSTSSAVISGYLNLPATFIAHVMRSHGLDWKKVTTNEHASRADRAQTIVNETCTKYHPVCEGIPSQIKNNQQ